MGVNYKITIVPEYSSNWSLETSVRTHLSQLIDVNRYNGNKTLRIIVFRPTGRPADEFNENVLPVLEGCKEDVYLFAAFSGGYKNISDLVPESVRHRVRAVEPIFIQAGELVSEASANYANNQTAFRRMTELMCREHGLTKIQTTTKRDNTPERTDLWSSFTSKIPFKGKSKSSKEKEHIEPTFAAPPPLERQQSLPKRLEVRNVIPYESEHVVLLAGVLHDNPTGIPVSKLCEIMNLHANDINRIVDQSSVFRKSPIGGKENVCLSQKLVHKLKEMKEGETYIEYMKNQLHSPSPSASSLTELSSTKDSLNPTVLEDLDNHFHLDGKLPEILSRCFEQFLGQTETPMEIAQYPPDTSLPEQDHQEEPVQAPCHEPKPDQNLPADLEMKPDLNGQADLEPRPEQNRHSDLEPKPDEGQLKPALEPEVTQDPNLMTESGRNKVQDPGTSTGEALSATDNFLLFLGQVSSRPETLQRDLVQLIERELHIPGKLIPALNNIHESIFGCRGSDPSVGYSKFLQIIEEPTEVIHSIKQIAREQLGLTDEELANGLGRICDIIKARNLQNV